MPSRRQRLTALMASVLALENQKREREERMGRRSVSHSAFAQLDTRSYEKIAHPSQLRVNLHKKLRSRSFVAHTQKRLK